MSGYDWRFRAILALAALTYACNAHMTDACLSRLENGDLRLTVQHWHSGDPQPDTTTYWTLTDGVVSDSGFFDATVSGCGSVCPTTCTNSVSCGASQSPLGAWYVDIDDTPPRFAPGALGYFEVLSGGVTMAPTGTCDTIGVFPGYGADEGAGDSIVIPLPRTACFANICGDGTVSPVSEECDGGQLNGATCQSLGFDGGVLQCSSCCSYDTSACLTCDDSINAPVLSGCKSGVVELVAEPGRCCAQDHFAVTASDADEAGGICPAPSVGRIAGQASGDCFSSGDAVVFMAVDSATNSDTCMWSYRVYDQEPPTFSSCPASASAYIGDAIAFVPAVMAQDNCAIMTTAQVSGPQEGTALYSPGVYTVIFQATDTSNLLALCQFDLTIYQAIIEVRQDAMPNLTPVAPNSDPSTADVAQPLALFMYLPITVEFTANYQEAFSFTTDDRAQNYLEIRDRASGSLQYRSELSPTIGDEDPYATFAGLHAVHPGASYELWNCMTDSTPADGVCVRSYVRVIICASPYTPDPPECVSIGQYRM